MKNHNLKLKRNDEKAFRFSLCTFHFCRRQAGFTLFFAVLVSSLLLAIGLAIFNITLKELILSSSVRNSQFAFYAADTGAECALYWDMKGDAFATSSPSTIRCNGQTIPNMGGGLISEFELRGEYCADVKVTKNLDGTTVTESRGYNTCDVSDRRRVERGIRIRY